MTLAVLCYCFSHFFLTILEHHALFCFVMYAIVHLPYMLALSLAHCGNIAFCVYHDNLLACVTLIFVPNLQSMLYVTQI